MSYGDTIRLSWQTLALKVLEYKSTSPDCFCSAAEKLALEACIIDYSLSASIHYPDPEEGKGTLLEMCTTFVTSAYRVIIKGELTEERPHLKWLQAWHKNNAGKGGYHG